LIPAASITAWRRQAPWPDDNSDDILRLASDLPEAYSPIRAADLVVERLGSRLRNAPNLDEIQGGAWRG